MTFSCYTLGCKTNQTETDALASALAARGHTRLDWGSSVQAIIINTCSVTAVSDKKSRGVISRARRENPNAVIAVHGCMAQSVKSKPPHINVLGGTGDRTGFIEEIERTVGDTPTGVSQNICGKKVAGEDDSPLHSARTRAFLKIQDGCSNACAYCIIPSLRGGSRSLPFEEILSGAKAFVDSGAKEIILTGIEISAYDGGAAALATNLAERFPETRFRLGSLDPLCVTRKFVETLSRFDNICPHFHLALQSGCDKTLSAMNRKYGAEQAAEAVRLLRGAFDCTLGCDLIVGFPGESDVDFDESLAFVEEQGFTFMHIFPYSKRPGTHAAGMAGQLTNAVKRERANRASALADRLFSASAAAQTELSVLFETEKDGYCIGHAENYFEAAVRGEGLRNEIRRVKIIRAQERTLIGELVH